MKKPRYYIKDLKNYTDDFLIEIILWQNQELRKLLNKERKCANPKCGHDKIFHDILGECFCEDCPCKKFEEKIDKMITGEYVKRYALKKFKKKIGLGGGIVELTEPKAFKKIPKKPTRVRS